MKKISKLSQSKDQVEVQDKLLFEQLTILVKLYNDQQIYSMIKDASPILADSIEELIYEFIDEGVIST